MERPLTAAEKAKKHIISDNKKLIPGYYSNYQQYFEYCDRFNAGLNDRCWPHKRGGRNTSGDLGAHNDFIQAATLRNTINAYLAITGISPKSIRFEDCCIDLANQLCHESATLDADYVYM